MTTYHLKPRTVNSLNVIYIEYSSDIGWYLLTETLVLALVCGRVVLGEGTVKVDKDGNSRTYCV
jgi:hypothetical protein